MPNAPVYYVLGQAQFNPVAAMSKYVDEIQDRLRRDGYTLFEPQQTTQLQFKSAAGGPPSSEPQVTQLTSWLLTKGDRSAGFILNSSSITFHTTHYETSDEFIPELLRGLKAVHEVASLEHVARMGLRYLDAVLPAPNESVDQYLADGLRGVEFGAKQRYALNESVFETNSSPLLTNGTLVVRIHRVESPLGYPPDMIPSGLIPMPKFQIDEVRTHAMIDTDHFVEGRMPLEFDKLADQLKSLHTVVRQVFDAVASKHALTVWFPNQRGI
jgi:uncharacterized protein (TIGR04255 family)